MLGVRAAGAPRQVRHALPPTRAICAQREGPQRSPPGPAHAGPGQDGSTLEGDMPEAAAAMTMKKFTSVPLFAG